MRTRRDFLKLTAAPAAAALGAWSTAGAQPRRLPLTPVCGDAVITPVQTEGPYFKPSSPLRETLVETGMPGTRLVLVGRVLSPDCAPIARALLDVWQADDRGAYDLGGFRLRGHQFTGADGRFRMETIVPGAYPGRTRHIHVKVQAPNRPPLTSQLYFPGDPGNGRDFIFDPSLVLKVEDASGAKVGVFDFVLQVGRPAS